MEIEKNVIERSRRMLQHVLASVVSRWGISLESILCPG